MINLMNLNYSMPHRTRPATLPGDRVGKREVARMIRVDHAGELGAQAIYVGQMAVLKDQPSAPLLSEMEQQESEHLQIFDKLMTERGVRPSVLSPLWRRIGYAIGAGSALVGEQTAMAVTVAVEEVIEEHYQQQLEQLGEDEPELRATISEFREDELRHRDTALKNGAEEAPARKLLSRSVKSGTKIAIWLAKRI